MKILKPKKMMALIILMTATGAAVAGSIGELDSSSRRMVREAELDGYGRKAKVDDNAQPGVSIQNQLDEFGKKKCIVSAGNVVTKKIEHGGRIENKTIVTGNIINVCQ